MSKKPKKLESGDTVAIVSPSWGGPSVFPGVYESGLEVLKEWGLKIKEYPSARMEAGFLRANPKVRADEQYCNGYPDWSDANNHSKTNALIKNGGW